MSIMSASLPDVIDEELLFCGLCLRYYNDEPKILPCLHIFCKTCLGQYVDKLDKQAASKPPLPKKPTHLAGNVKRRSLPTPSQSPEAVPTTPVPDSPMLGGDQNAKFFRQESAYEDHYEEIPQERNLSISIPAGDGDQEQVNYEDLEYDKLGVPEDVAPLPPLSPHSYLPMQRNLRPCPPVPKPRTKAKAKKADEGYEVPLSTPSPPSRPPSGQRNTIYVFDEFDNAMLKHSKSDWDILGEHPDKFSRSMSMEELEGDLDALVPCYYTEASSPLPVPAPRKRGHEKSPPAVLPPRMVPVRKDTKTKTEKRRPGNLYTGTPFSTGSESDKTFPCPSCSQKHVLPAAGVSAFRTCLFATSLQETVSAQSVSPRTCDNCEAKEADFKCLECAHYLCSACKQAHHWLKITKTHRVMTLKQLQSGKYQSEMLQRAHHTPCNAHQKQAAEYFCAQCDCSICEECKASEKHAGHSCATLQVAAARDRQFLGTLLNSLHNQEKTFADSAKSMKEYKEKCMKEKANLTEAIATQKDTIIQVLEEVTTELQRQVSAHYTTEISRVSAVAEENAQTAARIQHASRLAGQLQQHATPGHLVAMTTCLKHAVSASAGNDVKPQALDKEMKLHFERAAVCEDELLALLGRCVRQHIHSSPPPVPMHKAISEEKSYHTKDSPALLHDFRTKTDHDVKGCKPTGMAITDKDHLVVVDDINKKLKIFHESGKLIKELHPVGEGALIDPWDVVITKYGNFAVTDKGAGVVKIYDPEGDLVSTFGDHLKQPWGIATNSLGDIIVTDPVCHAVFIHDTAGTLKYSLGTGSNDQYFSCPEYVTVNQNDDIIVSDFQKHSVTIFDSIGRLLQRVGQKGRGRDEFNVPCGVTCDRDGGIYVADYNNQRVTRLDMNGHFQCFHLTMVDHLFWPQALGIDSKGRLIVIDGNSIKIFGQQGDRIEMQAAIPPEPKPKTQAEIKSEEKVAKLQRKPGVEKLQHSPYLDRTVSQEHPEDLPLASPLQSMIEAMTLVTPPRSKSEGHLKGQTSEAYDSPRGSQEVYDIPPSRLSYDVPRPSHINYTNTQYGVFHEEPKKYETLDSSGSFDSVNMMMASTEAIPKQSDKHNLSISAGNVSDDKLQLPTTKDKKQAKSKKSEASFDREKPVRKSLSAFTRRLSKQGKKKKLKELEKEQAAAAAEAENESNASLESSQRDKTETDV